MPLIVKRLTVRSHSVQAGFSLVELLVGLVIGLLVILVVMQVFSEFEGQKRTTMGTADAQTNGNIALYNVQRDAQLAGYGLPVFSKTNSPLLCGTLTTEGVSASVNDLSPITITDGGTGAGASDSVIVRYGTTPLGGVPVAIGGPTVTSAPAVKVGVVNNMGCQNGDVAIVTNLPSCVLTKVKSITGTTEIELKNGTGVTSGAGISCMGGWNSFTYAVNNSQLERNGTPNVADIVNMQAQYGISAAGNNNKITAWVDATGTTWDPATMTVADRNRIKAVRIAIVARNGLLEKENVTTACSSTSAANPTGLCAWDATSASPATTSPAPTIDLSKINGVDNPDWQRYRYRVYETIIPIRSMIWSKDALQHQEQS